MKNDKKPSRRSETAFALFCTFFVYRTHPYGNEGRETWDESAEILTTPQSLRGSSPYTGEPSRDGVGTVPYGKRFTSARRPSRL